MPEGDNQRDLRPDDNYLKKLNTLLPGEITGLYLFVRAGAQDNRDLDPYLAMFAILIATVFFFVSPKIVHINDKISRLLYSITFLLWAASIDIGIIQLRLNNWKPIGFLIAGFTAIWTFSLPFIFDALKEKFK